MKEYCYKVGSSLVCGDGDDDDSINNNSNTNTMSANTLLE
jgi:hypothetical protein